MRFRTIFLIGVVTTAFLPLSAHAPLPPLAASSDSNIAPQGRPLLRALGQVARFNRPTIRRRQRKGGDDAPPSELVLVTGATGGVGRRVVAALLSKGYRVRALARNEAKAKAMLSGGSKPPKNSNLEIMEADITVPESLRRNAFEDVSRIISCTAAIVQPRGGDRSSNETTNAQY